MDVFDLPSVEVLIRAALAEDLGGGDITTQLTVPRDARGRAAISAQESAVIAGTPLIRRIGAVAGGEVEVRDCIADGTRVVAGDVIATLAGSAHTLLAIERVTLNFLQHLSGIATLTARYVAAVSGCGCRIVDTRKTIPGLRVLEKYAVRIGGGFNHRHGLYDGILIKNNHITAAGGVAPAVTAARTAAPHGLKVEVECTTLSEVAEALAAGAEIILLDNMSPDALTQAVRRIERRAVVEASGGVNLDTVRAIAGAGVDIISIGALTHSAPAVDLHMTLFLE
ncbi:MAG TPA: carboxylating nicotinate-nucleotide diphosphorylase [Candidatus Acidoferrales bacterium]|nr:carboxylating nicotinate-nucleotide diphosphorylase [Candidatus Acidoferrales bacterium]